MRAGKKIYFENLDGLRFMAFLSVFIAHLFDFSGYRPGPGFETELINRCFLNGDLGVGFFFVLSGFLITYLLSQEKEQTQTVSIAGFYKRRILRIWPVYFLTVLAGFFIVPFVFSNFAYPGQLPFKIDVPSAKLPWYCFFAVNFDVVLNGISYLMVAVLWSVSVEEQYYLVWPLLNRFLSRRQLGAFIALLLVASFIYRLVFYQYSYNVSYSTWSVMGYLAVGSVLGMLSYSSEKWKRYFADMKTSRIVVGYILLFLCIPLRSWMWECPAWLVRPLVGIQPLVFSALFGFVIMEQNFSRHSFYKFSRFKVAAYLGKISYGLYSYHMISVLLVCFLFNRFAPPGSDSSFFYFVLKGVLCFLLAAAVSAFSFRFFERPFLSLKDRFESR